MVFWLPVALLIASMLALFAVGIVPIRLMKQSSQDLGRLVTVLAWSSASAAITIGVQVAAVGVIEATWTLSNRPLPVSFKVHIDGVAIAMLVSISFVAGVIARFSSIYLRKDAAQARFFRGLSLTLAAMLLLALSSSLLMLAGGWIATGIGLQSLLTACPGRTVTTWAARKRALTSRLGDALLITALALTYQCFGTVEFPELFQQTSDLLQSNRLPAGTAAIGVLLVLAALTKSAQFPFHSWLPAMIETPTPVLALLNAGVINVGAFLVIRMSPVISLSPMALSLLTLSGAVTAIVGSVTMLTQTSIKRSLACSTLAQIGFLMVLCGLEAYTAALLHLIGHSVYKAFAILSSGSVLETRTTVGALDYPAWSRTVGHGMLAIVGYVVAYQLVDRLAANAIPQPAGSLSTLGIVLAIFVVSWFVGTIVIPPIAKPFAQHRWARAAYVHALNGFYLDIPARRLTDWIYGQPLGAR